MARWRSSGGRRPTRIPKKERGGRRNSPPVPFKERLRPFISLNPGVHYYYQIDTVVLLQTGIYKSFLTQDRRGAPAIFALLGVVARPASCCSYEQVRIGRTKNGLFRRARIK